MCVGVCTCVCVYAYLSCPHTNIPQLTPGGGGAPKPRQRKLSLMTIAADINPISEEEPQERSPRPRHRRVGDKESTQPALLPEEDVSSYRDSERARQVEVQEYFDGGPDHKESRSPDTHVTFSIHEIRSTQV